MKVVIDMNLSPNWVAYLKKYEIQSVHWSDIGHPAASDTAIMEWARENGYVVFTHDLDFGSLLALTQTKSPSVLQVRSQDTFTDAIGSLAVAALQQCEDALEKGALVTVDASKTRVRLLPFE